MGGLTEGREKQHYWFVFPFVEQTNMSDAMQSVVCTEKWGEERMGTSELKSLLKINCPVPRSRWRAWMDTQGYVGGSGCEH